MTQHPEYQYLNLMQEILDKGVRQEDKGTGDVTHSLFGRQIRFDLSQGFPLLTTKKTYWKGILIELCWFMSGQSNIKYLVDNNIHIWDDYPYRIYREKMAKGLMPELSKDEFIAKIAADAEFAKQHGELPKIYGELWRRWPQKMAGPWISCSGWLTICAKTLTPTTPLSIPGIRNICTKWLCRKRLPASPFVTICTSATLKTASCRCS